jgi:hypothetical protein
LVVVLVVAVPLVVVVDVLEFEVMVPRVTVMEFELKPASAVKPAVPVHAVPLIS